MWFKSTLTCVFGRYERAISSYIVTIAMICLAAQSTTAGDLDAPSEFPSIEETIIEINAYAGEPYGVGRVQLLFGDDIETNWNPDQSIRLTDRDGKVRYPAFQVFQSVSDENESSRMAELTTYFLFTGEEQIGPMEISWSNHAPIKTTVTQVRSDPVSHRKLANEWWTNYSRNHRMFIGEQREVVAAIEQVIGTRMNFDTLLNRHGSGEEEATKLEAGFERIVRTLFGFDSVILSMPKVEPSNSYTSSNQAVHQPPRPLRLSTVAIPHFKNGGVEQIAEYVPSDCFYVRCNSVNNYLWLRGMMTNWGGSLDEIISMPTLDYETRDKLERQLAMQLNSALEEGLKEAVGEVALIGQDLLFRDGPTLGVVFEAKDEIKLSKILQSQRHRISVASTNVTVEKFEIGNELVTYISNPEHTVRSFHTRRGRYHLITNSRHLVEQFLKLSQGGTSLAGLREFQYARSKYPLVEDGRCFIYLSDPFFRHLASPVHRIELYRRAHRLMQIKLATVAAMVAQSEGVHDLSINHLVESKYLPVSFITEPASLELTWTPTGYIDSLRGRRGTFLPVSDMELEKVTFSEFQSFQRFASRYRQQWRVADPVVVVFNSNPINLLDREKINIDISVTPYARNRYASLRSLLGDVSTLRVAPIKGDLLSINASLRSSGSARKIHLGIQDSDVPFRMESGKVTTTTGFEGQTLLKRNLYGVVTPKGIDSLRSMQSFAEEFRLIEKQPTKKISVSSYLSASAKWGLYAFTGLNINGFKKSSDTTIIDTWEDWSIFAKNQTVKKRTLPQLTVQESTNAAQVWMHLSDVKQSKANDYIQAYMFLESRKASARNAQFLDLISQQLGTKGKETIERSEQILAAKLVCPLDGEYTLENEMNNDCGWTSTAWDVGSYFETRSVSEDYQFSFLNWLHQMDLSFQLDATTLTSHIELIVDKSEIPESDTLAHRIASANSPTLISRPMEAGQIVIVTREGAELMIGSEIASRLSKGSRLRLLKFKNGWAGVSQVHGERIVRGWIDPDDISHSPAN